MNQRMTILASTTVIALASGMALGTDTPTNDQPFNHATNTFPDSIAHPDTIMTRDLADRLLPLLPAEDKAEILAANGLGSEAFQPKIGIGIIAHELDSDEDFAKVAQYATPELWTRMSDTHRTMLLSMVDRAENGLVPAAACFAPGTDPELAMAFSEALYGQVNRFQQTSRWSTTATNGGGLTQGTPTTITYSFVPDGTFVPNLIGVSGNSDLHSWLNGIYGSQATWQPLFEQVFANWSEVCANTYIYEPNDDGVALNGASGSLGVRGDVRIAAIDIDGNSGVLAYNNFPNDGDMVFDSADNFYNSTGSNSLRLRNIISHEHGHGAGMLHVCPVNGTKLMEPFINLSFDGLQLDEILNAQRHYGDVLEPNDNPLTQATDLGSFGGFGVSAVSGISIDDNSDLDYFLVTITSPSQVTFTVTPAAATYVQGPQTGACDSGTNTNYNVIHDLNINVYDTDNVFVSLQTEDSTSAGAGEVMVFNAIETGDYLFRVAASTSTNSIQLYNMTLLTEDLPFLDPTISATAPDFVDPGVPTSFPVTINPNDDTIVGGSEQLFYRINGGTYSSTPLTPTGGNSYTATLPAANCDDSLDFYISVEGDTAGIVTLPADGAGSPLSATIGSVAIAIDDNFESNMGWTVSGDASGSGQGEWERAIPAGDGSRGDAPNDYDGSGRCYVTGNGGPGSNTDVDGGQTILTSPTFDLSANPEARVSYARWYDNTGSGTGAAPGADVFTVQISNNNGSSWTNLEVVGPVTGQSSGGWFTRDLRIADFVPVTDQVRVRFIAEDADSGSVIEAAVDAFKIAGSTCEDPATCAADLTGDGIADVSDVFAFLDAYNNGQPLADFNNDGLIDITDVFAFLTVYNAGCP